MAIVIPPEDKQKVMDFVIGLSNDCSRLLAAGNKNGAAMLHSESLGALCALAIIEGTY